MHRPLGNCWFISSTQKPLPQICERKGGGRGNLGCKEPFGSVSPLYSFPDILVLETLDRKSVV